MPKVLSKIVDKTPNNNNNNKPFCT